MPRGGSKPGQRRGGRKKGVPNKATFEIRAMALQHAPAALAAAVRLVKTGKTEPGRIAAINIILDRAYGKPGQAVTHSGSIGSYDVTKLASLSDEELKLFESVLARIAPGAAAAVGGEGGDSEAG